MTSLKCRIAGALLGVAAAGSVQAFNYDESIHGDLAGTLAASGGSNPTVLTATPGVNSIALGVPPGGDRDYFTFSVPTGFLLSSIIHKTYISTDNLSFIGFQSGSQLTEPLPPSTNAGNLLGYLHFGPTTVLSASNDGEIIDLLGGSGSSTPAAMGFVPPLPAGNYTFWVQQTGVVASYSFDFLLSPIPEPEQWALMLGGVALLAARLRRTRATANEPR
jgi:hypothetical protein